MEGSVQTLASADDRRELGSSLVIGLDFGLCAPGEELIHATAGFQDRSVFRHLGDTLIHTGDELPVGEGKIIRASDLQDWVLGL